MRNYVIVLNDGEIIHEGEYYFITESGGNDGTISSLSSLVRYLNRYKYVCILPKGSRNVDDIERMIPINNIKEYILKNLVTSRLRDKKIEDIIR